MTGQPDQPQSNPRTPLVTVVMPFLNAERHIAAAIDSVRGQTLARWELLLVDDGSSDNSRSIADDFARRDPVRIRVLQHPGGINCGIAASRNLAMQAALGRYIAFLDADDLYEPQRLEKHVRELEADADLGVVVSADLYWHEAPAGRQPSAPALSGVIRPAAPAGRRIEAPAFIVATLLTPGAPMPATCSVTFRRAAFEAIGGAPDEFRGPYEDQVLLCKLLLRYSVLTLSEPLARYRQHGASVTQGNAPLERVPGSAAHEGRLRFLRWLQGHLATHGFDLPELQAWLATQVDDLVRLDGRMAADGTGARCRTQIRRAATTFLPGRAVRMLERGRQQLGARRVRRRVARRIEAFEATQSGGEPAVKAYWNRRVNDTRHSNDSPGTAEFYAALDAYRLRKNPYLPEVVDFAAWADKDVLEIGCGPGLDLVRFAKGGARVTGIDVASAAIELAQGCCRAAGVEATLLEANGANLPFAGDSFDLVYCHGVLSFVRDPARVVAEAHRVLRPGGQAILMVYNRRSWMNALLRIPGLPVGIGHADAPGFRTWTPVEFEQLLAPFTERRLAFERWAPVGLPAAAARWLRPFGWHLLAFCRKAA